MAWVRFDDTFWTHPKLERLSDKAHRLYLRSIGYCAQHLTDGVLDDAALRTLGALKRHADELVAGGCWDIIPDGGYTVHDYLEFNPTREAVLARRRKEADKKARQRETPNRHPETGEFT